MVQMALEIIINYRLEMKVGTILSDRRRVAGVYGKFIESLSCCICPGEKTAAVNCDKILR